MFIEIRELELHPVDFREELAPGVIDLGPDFRQLDPLRLNVGDGDSFHL